MATYQITPGGIVIRDDGANIPPDSRNSDYRAYLAWVAAGNTAPVLPAPPRGQADLNADDLRAKATTALTNNAAFQAIASPTNAQAVTQVQALTRQVNGLIRLANSLLDDTSGT